MQPYKLNNKYFLLDSCIIEYLFNEDLNSIVDEQLIKWSDDIFKPAISDITYAELIDGVIKDKEDRLVKLLDKFYNIAVTQRVLKGSGKMGCVYKEKDNQFSNISLGDKIIAATSVIHNIIIVTANIKDFPYPFFESIASESLVYFHKTKKRMISIALLKPNYEYINYAFENRK